MPSGLPLKWEVSFLLIQAPGGKEANCHMIILRVDLEEANGKSDQLVMTAITPFGDARFSGLVLHEQFMRPVYYETIVQASDAASGEIICPRLVCGARPAPFKPNPLRGAA